MSDATVNIWIPEATSGTGKPSKPKKDWPLMGDIVSHRAGVPDHLIQWRRAQNEPDPEPTL
ncbi:MAG: hypothetical protein OXQ92_05200 [Boseongicola sp.]|nr:hypothetical protein [Boseongicola sp.]MDD9977852.1 hypothetical protein [Boseongicola sp.]